MSQAVTVVGLTGGIGSGKSSAGRAFSELGVRVTDADQIAREVVEPGTEALARIRDHFGAGILQADGHLNRAALRAIIFASPEQKQFLEQLLHPIIRQTLMNRLAESHPCSYQILESPLLLETDQRALVDKVIVVDVSPQTQLERACLRDGNSEVQIRAIMASQMTREQRLAQADYVLDNEGLPAQLIQQVNALHQQLINT